MSQLKPMIIVLLMLTSALAGCTGTDGAEGIPGPQEKLVNRDCRVSKVNQVLRVLLDKMVLMEWTGKTEWMDKTE